MGAWGAPRAGGDCRSWRVPVAQPGPCPESQAHGHDNPMPPLPGADAYLVAANLLQEDDDGFQAIAAQGHSHRLFPMSQASSSGVGPSRASLDKRTGPLSGSDADRTGPLRKSLDVTNISRGLHLMQGLGPTSAGSQSSRLKTLSSVSQRAINAQTRAKQGAAAMLRFARDVQIEARKVRMGPSLRELLRCGWAQEIHGLDSILELKCPSATRKTRAGRHAT